ncbi:hypothetical protein C1X73_13820 [Pseudomonas sp. FW305-130]|nr:hypothetical protein C1X74_23715 [Pseudomonas sp. GW460-5]PNB58387.1 hypothetical protein C1X73_13820 [Pseudomonas sp. FW305-130]
MSNYTIDYIRERGGRGERGDLRAGMVRRRLVRRLVVKLVKLRISSVKLYWMLSVHTFLTVHAPLMYLLLTR